MPRLLEALQNSVEGSIFFIIFDANMTLKKVSYELTREFGSAMRVVSLAKEKAPLEKLAKIPRQRSRNRFVFIQQLEKHIHPSNTSLTQHIFAALDEQFSRGKPSKKTLIFSIPVQVVDFFQKRASRLWEMRQGLYYFEESIKDPLRLSHFLCDHFANSDGHQWCTEKQALFAFYQLLQMETQSLTSEEKLFFEYDIYGKIGRLLYKSGNYQEAFQQFKKQRETGELLKDKALLPEVLNNLALLCEARGRLQDALSYFQQSLNTAETAFRGENHPVKAIISNNMGKVYWALGNEAAANRACRNARRMFDHKLGNRHPLLVPALIKLNAILTFQGKYEQALDNYRYALQLVERFMGLNHPYMSVILQHIGTVYYYQQKYELALRYISRNMETIERALGAEHPYLSVPLNMMGLVHWRCGNIKRALRYLYWAIDIRHNVVGPKDPEIAGIFKQLGEIYQEQKNVSDAQRCFHQALDIYQQCFPSDHPSIWKAEHDILQLEKIQNPEKQKNAS